MKDRTLDVALSALTFVAVTGLAILTFLRYRETGRLASFVQSSAFALWAMFTFVTLLLMVFRLDGQVGIDPWCSRAAAVVGLGQFVRISVSAS